MLRWNLFLSCCNTTEVCGTAQAISLVSQPGLEMGSKLAGAAPWEEWVSSLQSNASPLPRVFSHIVFLPSPPLHTALKSNPEQTHWHCSSAREEQETLFLWGTRWGAGLSFLPPAVCAHSFSSCYQRLQAPFSATVWLKGGGTVPAQGPFTIAPTALPLALSFGLLPTELQGSGGTVWALHLHQLFSMKQAEISPGYSGVISPKAEEWSRGSSCEAQPAPGQSPLPFSGSWGLQGGKQTPAWVLCHRSTSTEIQVKRFGFWQKHVGSRFLPRGCSAGLCMAFTYFILSFRKIWGEQRAKALLYSPDAPNQGINRNKSNQGRKKKFGWRD